jgi:crossover junction endodeoxyribonuclease RuvC
MDEPRCIVGIDPGLNITGYGVLQRHPQRAVVREAGVIRPGDAKHDLTDRLKAIYDGLLEIVEQYKPEAMAVEQLYAHYAHPRTAILMGHARGVVFLAAAHRNVPVFSYSATRVKKTVTGHGRASKEQIQRTIERELGLKQPCDPPDVADALAVALCHMYLAKLPTNV